MSQGEQKLADVRGQFLLAEKNGRPLPDATWETARLVLSTRRLVLGCDDITTIPLDRIQSVGDRLDASLDARQVSEYITVRLPDRTYLVATDEHDHIELMLFRALLDNRTILVKHPAVEGGVITDNQWEPAKIRVGDGSLAVAIKGGRFVDLALDEVSGIDAEHSFIRETEQIVSQASHATANGTIVETHLAAPEPLGDHLQTYLQQRGTQGLGNVELSAVEREVLMALYSGISPFDIPAFLDRDVDEVEEIFDRMIDLEIVDEIRRRREVQLNPRGRNLASDQSQHE